MDMKIKATVNQNLTQSELVCDYLGPNNLIDWFL